MLILTRKVLQSIKIGDEIIVKLLEVKGKQVRLGVEAPPGLHIDREEVYERKQLEKALYASRTTLDLSGGAGPDDAFLEVGTEQCDKEEIV